MFGFFGEKPVTYRASIQIAWHKRPVRHLVVISQELFATTLGADGQARRTILYDGSVDFTLHRRSVCLPYRNGLIGFTRNYIGGG